MTETHILHKMNKCCIMEPCSPMRDSGAASKITLALLIGNVYGTIMIDVRDYIRADNSSPFADWFDDLDVQAALKVNTYLTRVENGNHSSVKSVGGGTKKRQQKDIDAAKALWREYKTRKKI